MLLDKAQLVIDVYVPFATSLHLNDGDTVNVFPRRLSRDVTTELLKLQQPGFHIVGIINISKIPDLSGVVDHKAAMAGKAIHMANVMKTPSQTRLVRIEVANERKLPSGFCVRVAFEAE